MNSKRNDNNNSHHDFTIDQDGFEKVLPFSNPRFKLKMSHRINMSKNPLIKLLNFSEIDQLNSENNGFCSGIKSLSESSVLFISNTGIKCINLINGVSKTVVSNIDPNAIDVQTKNMLMSAIIGRSELKVFNLSNNDGIFHQISRDSRYSKTLLLDDDPSSMISAQENGVIQKWDLNSDQKSYELNTKCSAKDFDYGKYHSLIALASSSDNIRLYDNRSPVDTQYLRGHYSECLSVKFLMSNFLISSSEDMTSRLWDLRHTQRAVKVFECNESPVQSFEFDENRRVVYLLEKTGNLSCLLINGNIERTNLKVPGNGVGIALSPSCQRIFLGVTGKVKGIISASPQIEKMEDVFT